MIFTVKNHCKKSLQWLLPGFTDFCSVWLYSDSAGALQSILCNSEIKVDDLENFVELNKNIYDGFINRFEYENEEEEEAYESKFL